MAGFRGDSWVPVSWVWLGSEADSWVPVSWVWLGSEATVGVHSALWYYCCLGSEATSWVASALGMAAGFKRQTVVPVSWVMAWGSEADSWFGLPSELGMPGFRGDSWVPVSWYGLVQRLQLGASELGYGWVQEVGQLGASELGMAGFRGDSWVPVELGTGLGFRGEQLGASEAGWSMAAVQRDSGLPVSWVWARFRGATKLGAVSELGMAGFRGDSWVPVSWVWLGSEADSWVPVSWVWPGVQSDSWVPVSWVWLGSEATVGCQ
ncbi:hypothetical protein DPMN_010331 [Dreissena polymorpha]|uniref:Uncharacterized protein n=1 Tax=Dreissena polymorpha TaxID=45954 RepID=A0A9D4MYL4_DREPO|nr:hypothetical protein DPMN_010331 [Dreissena polymorpha]